MTYEEKFDILIEDNIATENEINLVVKINGYTEEQLENILLIRTGYRSFESYVFSKREAFDFELFDEDCDDDDDRDEFFILLANSLD